MFPPLFLSHYYPQSLSFCFNFYFNHMFRFKGNAHWLNSLLSLFLNRRFCCLTDSISPLLWDYFPSQASFNFALLQLLMLLCCSLFKVTVWGVGFFRFYACVVCMHMHTFTLTCVSTTVARYWVPSCKQGQASSEAPGRKPFLCLLAMVTTCIHWLDSISTFSFHVVDFAYIFHF